MLTALLRVQLRGSKSLRSTDQPHLLQVGMPADIFAVSLPSLC